MPHEAMNSLQAKQLIRPSKKETEESDKLIILASKLDLFTLLIFGLIAICGLLASMSSVGLSLWLAGALLFTSVWSYLLALGVGAENPNKLCDRIALQPLIARALARRERAYRDRLQALDRAEGWRPREGAPHPPGRTDTYPRYRVEAEASERGLSLQAVRWSYGIYHKDGWGRAPDNYLGGTYEQRLGAPPPFSEGEREEMERKLAWMEERCARLEMEGRVEHERAAEQLALSQIEAELINSAPSL